MDEFVNIKWEDDKITHLEKLANQMDEPFLSDDTIDTSYVFAHLKNPLILNVEETPSDESELKEIHRPYVPGREFYKNEKYPKSSLTKWQQRQCLEAFILITSGRYNPQKQTEQEKQLIQTYEKFRPKINEENAKFLEYAKQMWYRKKRNLHSIKSPLSSYSCLLMEYQCKRFLRYPRFFKEVDTISISYTEEEAPIEMSHLENILELGKVPKFTMPDFRSGVFLSAHTLPSLSNENSLLHSQTEVSRDENVRRIIGNHLIDVVISLSGLKRIIDNADSNSSWCLPFSIEEVDVKVDQHVVKKKMVFFDKPLPNKSVHFEKCYKRLVKTNLCRFEALSYPNVDTEVTEKEQTLNISDQMKVLHNASYRIWKLRQNYDDVCELLKTKKKSPEFRLLVRCKLDACELAESGALVPLVLVPKLQHQLEYGGEIQTKSELIREWISLFFRPYSNSYRVHIGKKKSEVVLIEKSNLSRVNMEAFSNYNMKPHLGLGILYKVIEKVVGFKAGEYLLRHLPQQGLFAAVYKKSSENEHNTFDLHAEASNYNFDGKSLKPWCPIDVNLVMPSFKAYKRMPGMFPPAAAVQIPKKGKKSKKKKKRKNQQTSTL